MFFLVSYCWECFMPIWRNLKHDDCFLKDKTNLYNMYKIKLCKTSKCLWPLYYIINNVCYEMNFFFKISINRLPKTHRSFLSKITIDLLYWDNHDVNLLEKLDITVKLHFNETTLKQDYDLQCFFLKITRETVNILKTVVIHYFS